MFVARAHSCFLAFGKRELESGLVDKMTACLDIMESHLVDPSSIGSQSYNGYAAAAAASTPVAATSTASSKKRKLPTPDAVFSASPAVPSSASVSASGSSSSTSESKSKSVAHNLNHHQNYYSHDTPVVKRKRGRPPKSSMQQIMQQQQRSLSSATPVEASPAMYHRPAAFESNEENAEDESMSSSASSRHISRDNSQSSNRTKGGNVNVADATSTAATMPCSPHGVSLRRPDPSLQELMSRFEDQYNEMGQRYTEMGTILAQMKTTLAVTRERSEQEIRRELLDEVQKSLIESLPKK